MLLRNGKTYSIQTIKQNKIVKEDELKESIKLCVVEKDDNFQNECQQKLVTNKIKIMIDKTNYAWGFENKLAIVIDLYKYILENKDTIKNKMKNNEKLIKIIKRKYIEMTKDIEQEINKKIGEKLLNLNQGFLDMKEEIIEL